MRRCAVSVFFAVALCSPVYGGTVDWAVWQSTAAGTITLSDATVVAVGLSSGSFGYCNCDHWSPATTYESVAVSNAPVSGFQEITGGGESIFTLTFGQTVVDPVLAIISLGSPGTEVFYDFSAPFTLLSTGPGMYGNGSFYQSAAQELRGAEGNGAIQFNGSFDSLSWSAPVYEHWQEFTVGIPDAQTPEPSPAVLLLAGIGFIAVARRR